MRQALPEFRAFENTCHVFLNESFFDKKTVKEFDGHEAPRNTGGLQAAFFLQDHKLKDMLALDLGPVFKFLLFEKMMVGFQVLAVGRDCIGREALFDKNIIEEFLKNERECLFLSRIFCLNHIQFIDGKRQPLDSMGLAGLWACPEAVVSVFSNGRENAASSQLRPYN